MVQTLGSTNIDLKEYARLYGKIHYQTFHQGKTMRDLLVVIILTKYHFTKGIKFFRYPGVDAVLKELKKLHDRMVMNPKTLKKCHAKIRSRHGSILCFWSKINAVKSREGIVHTEENRESILPRTI